MVYITLAIFTIFGRTICIVTQRNLILINVSYNVYKLLYNSYFSTYCGRTKYELIMIYMKFNLEINKDKCPIIPIAKQDVLVRFLILYSLLQVISVIYIIQCIL